MGQLLDESESSYTRLERGQVVDGVVMSVDKDGILVNVGQKTEGMVAMREMRSLSPEDAENIKTGDTITVVVVRPETEEGMAILSVDRARGEMGWRRLQEFGDNGTVVEAMVTGFNKGGAVVEAEGVQGFVPLSQLSQVGRPTGDGEINPQLPGLVGKTLRLKVIEVNRKRNRAIFSERAASQEIRQQQKQVLMEELEEGSVRQGRISGITKFGAFVDLGGADGLIHISELSWQSVRSPEDVVKVGDVVDVYVIKIDKETKRIALSLKRTKPEPWTEIASKYVVGQVTQATITKLATFGAFARIDDTVEGLIHISELSDRIVQHPKEVVKEGDNVAVKIVRIDPERRRIGLSIKQVGQDEADEVMDSYQGEAGEHRVERPALNAAMAAQLTQAMSAQQQDDTPSTS